MTICPVCRRTVPTAADGIVRRHWDGARRLCPMSGQAATAATVPPPETEARGNTA